MVFDDRLATVLRFPARSERAARTQFRQLLDLLGTLPSQADGELVSDAFSRLAELAAAIPAEEQSRILREPGLRLRSPALVAFLSQGDPKPAAAALASARLSDAEWIKLIPGLPIVARGFLRHRRDLPEGAIKVLARLGIYDLVLPRPDVISTQGASPAPSGEEHPKSIHTLLRRIEAFREHRAGATRAPRLPLGDGPAEPGETQLTSFEFTSDAEHRIDWTSENVAPFLVGMRIGPSAPGIIARLGSADARAMRNFQPLRNVALELDCLALLSGTWRIDAEPAFTRTGGHFAGYRGRMRRPLVAAVDSQPGENSTDRMRQLLHELRTPVNAIQGFAEIIQQQLFGAAPNEYRALAAAIAVDSAKLLAGFDEVDRLARLEGGALSLDEGNADLRLAVADTIQRLDGVLRAREAGFTFGVGGSPFTTCLSRDDLVALVWRIFASLAGVAGPGERMAVRLESDGAEQKLDIALPASLCDADDIFAVRPPATRPVVSAGMFGAGFAFRLARAEAGQAGGQLAIGTDSLVLSLPVCHADVADPDGPEDRMTGS